MNERLEKFEEFLLSGESTEATSMISDGLDLEACDPSGFTPLMLAVKAGKEDVIRELLKSGASPDAIKHGEGESALLLLPDTMLANKFELARALLEGGANPNVVANDGTTMLHRVIEAKILEPKIVTLLVEYGAKQSQRNKKNQTALELAYEKINELGEEPPPRKRL